MHINIYNDYFEEFSFWLFLFNLVLLHDLIATKANTDSISNKINLFDCERI